jgi:GTPase SAR1 family protein
LKLLLLGAGESGKSTIAKQMKILHLDGFSKEEKQMYTIAIHQNIYGAMRNMVQAAQKFQIEIKEIDTAKKFDEPALVGARISPEFAEEIGKLWRDEGIQKTFARRAEFQLVDSTQYWLDDVKRVASDDFVPTEQDVLRARIQTTGIVEIRFKFKGHEFVLVDVGGQRSERKKWIHCFQDVTAILFCAGLSEFDQVLYEDNKTNRMHEALNLFREICLSKWFLKSAIVLFLNKSDLLESKLKEGKNIKAAFPDYKGSNSYEEVVDYVKKAFTSVNDPATGKPREVFAHVTNATNTDNVKKVFDSVETSVTNMALATSGLAF